MYEKEVALYKSGKEVIVLRNIKITSCLVVLALFAGSFFLGRFAAQVAPTVSSAIQDRNSVV